MLSPTGIYSSGVEDKPEETMCAGCDCSALCETTMGSILLDLLHSPPTNTNRGLYADIKERSKRHASLASLNLVAWKISQHPVREVFFERSGVYLAGKKSLDR